MPHIHYQYDFVIVVFIVHGDKVLLVNHPRYGKWIPMGGHVELNEDPEETLFREIREETGLTVEVIGGKPTFGPGDAKPVYAPRYIDVHEANAPHKHISLVYFATSKSGNFTLSGEHTAIEWLGLEDLDKPQYALTGSVRFYCREAIKAARAV